jgi:hypothetical protein
MTLLVNNQVFNDKLPCEPYMFNPLHLFLPPMSIFDNLCVSHSKTQLFIVACIRLVISWIISYYSEPLLSKTNYDFVINIIYIWITINIISIIIILTKMPLFYDRTDDNLQDPIIVHQYVSDDLI